MYKFTFTIKRTDRYGVYLGESFDMTISVIAKNRKDAINKAVEISGYEDFKILGCMTVEPYKESE